MWCAFRISYDLGAAAAIALSLSSTSRMWAVTGILTSSKPISLSKASAILYRFAAADIGARRDVAAYLKLASTAFEDLVQVHRELRSSRKRSEQRIQESEEETSRRKKKEKGGDPNPCENSQAEIKLEEVLEDEGAKAEERRNKKKKKKKKKKRKERDDGSWEIRENGNLAESEGSKIEEWRDLEKNCAELNGKVKVEVEEEVEEEERYRSGETKKKKEEKKSYIGGGKGVEGSEIPRKKRMRIGNEE